MTVLGSMSIDIFAASLPVIAEEFGSSIASAQVTFTLFLAGMGLGQLMWGPMSDRVGRRLVVAIGLSGWILTSVGGALATDLTTFVLLRLLAGVFGSTGVVIARSIVRDLAPTPRVLSSGIGWLSTVSSMAPTVAPVLGALIAAAWGWRADFVSLAVVGIIMLSLFMATVPETAVHRETARLPLVRAIASGLQGAFRNRELRFVACALALQAVGFYAYISSMSFIVESRYGHSSIFFATLFGVNAGAMLIANVIFRYAARTKPITALMGVGLTLSAVSGPMLFVASWTGLPEAVLWISTTLFASSMGIIFPAAHTWGQSTGVLSGSASALTGSAQFLGGVLGSPLTGIFGSTPLSLGAVIGVSSVLAIMAWRFAKKRRALPL